MDNPSETLRAQDAEVVRRALANTPGVFMRLQVRAALDRLLDALAEAERERDVAQAEARVSRAEVEAKHRVITELQRAFDEASTAQKRVYAQHAAAEAVVERQREALEGLVREAPPAYGVRSWGGARYRIALAAAKDALHAVSGGESAE